MIELYILLIFMIVAAVAALEISDVLSSVIVLGGLGVMLVLVFLILRAPDLAITLLAVEILSLIILIRATLRRDLPAVPGGGWWLPTATGLGFGALLMWVGVRCFNDLPGFGEPKLRVAQHYLDEGLLETGANNLVTAVILDYRAFDTLGEATVLFTAVMAVLAVVRTVGRKKSTSSQGPNDE